ncbi:MAG: hypothetical protein NT166_09025 [Candidatus Aminicenantes bacterium]|nr:hypothetical protein [Candidatus Aminicenantes bacterium]
MKIFFLICLFIIAFNLPGDAGDAGDAGDVGDAGDAVNLGAKYEAYIAINYYLNLFDFEKAEALVDDYLAKNPDDPFILSEKAYLLKDIKNEHGEAAAALKRVKAIYPDYYYANYLLASLLFLYRDADKIPGLEKPAFPVDEALKYLGISIKNNGQFFDSLFLMGAILSDTGKPNESNEYLEKALRVRQTPEPYFYMANNYRQLKDVENEIRAYKKILTYSPYNPRALSEISNYLLRRGDLKNASGYLERLFLKYPDDKSISTEYLQVLFGAREVEKFLEVSDTVDISGSPLLVFARAFFLGEKERYTEALQLLNGLKEKDVKTNLLLADIYKRKKDYFDAYRTLQGVADKDKDFLFYSLDMEVLSLLDMNRQILNVFEQIKKDKVAAAELSLSDYYNVIFAFSNLYRVESLPELLQWIKTTVKMPEETAAVDELARAVDALLKGKTTITEGERFKFDNNNYLMVNLYNHGGKYDSAAALLKEMIKKEKRPAPYLELGQVYILQKKTTAAETLIKEMRRLFPSDVDVKNLYAYFLALENKELEKALQLSKETLAADGESAAYLDTCGYILFKMGRAGEALGFLEKAYRKNPFEPDIMEHLADCYRLQKGAAKIIEIYQRAMDNGVDFKDRLPEKIKRLGAGQPPTPKKR